MRFVTPPLPGVAAARRTSSRHAAGASSRAHANGSEEARAALTRVVGQQPVAQHREQECRLERKRRVPQPPRAAHAASAAVRSHARARTRGARGTGGPTRARRRADVAPRGRLAPAHGARVKRAALEHEQREHERDQRGPPGPHSRAWKESGGEGAIQPGARDTASNRIQTNLPDSKAARTPAAASPARGKPKQSTITIPKVVVREN